MVGHVGFAFLTLGAIAQQLSIQVDNNGSIVNFFSYFTNLSNIFAALVLVASAPYLAGNRKTTAGFDVIRGTSVVCMVLVGIVFSVLLRDVDLGHLQPWVNFVLHYLMPVVIVLDWVAWPPQRKLQTRSIKYWMIFPLLYVAYILVRGAQTDWYPYPFLNPAKSGGYGGVTAYCIGILFVFLASSWVLLWAGNRLRSKHR